MLALDEGMSKYFVARPGRTPHEDKKDRRICLKNRPELLAVNYKNCIKKIYKKPMKMKMQSNK